MADSKQDIEWYLARDGQQHGPVTDTELRKIIELGYLRPTDLVWRQGMPEWALAETVLDLKPAAPAPAPARPAAQAKTAEPAPRPIAPEPARIDASGVASTRPEPERPAPHRPQGFQSAPGPTARHDMPHGAGQTLDGPINSGPGGMQHRPMPRDPHPAPGYQSQRPGLEGAAQQRWDVPGPAGASVKPGLAMPAQPQKPNPNAVPGQRSPAPARRDSGRIDEPAGDERRGFPWRTAIILVLLAGLAGGGFALYRSGQLANLPFLAAPAASGVVPVVNRPTGAARDESPQAAVAVPSGSADAIDDGLQKTPLWQRLKRDFPEWYQERISDLARLSGESKSEREITAAMVRSLIELRRRHQADALAASPAKLRSIAASFVANLSQLSRESTAACYGYISQGEASPAVAELKKPEQRAAIDAQLEKIFDAVAEGRKSPAKREPPRREDYDVLSAELAKKGWSPADLQLFTDARALSRAAPEKVCQMVQDWFSAQLAVEDEATRVRLLGEALKPVVAG